MRVKGTAVKAIQEFVKKYHGTCYAEWIKSMPVSSRELMNTMINVSEWYPITDASIEPIKAIGKLFYSGDNEKAAWETGRYSAEVALGGVYKIFRKMATPKFIVERSAKIITVYYEPSEVKINDATDKSVHLTFTVLPLASPILESRIAGWVQRALEVTGRKNVVVDIPKSHARGDNITEMNFKWE